MRKYGFSALAAAGLLVGGLTAGSASAADLGGNCCADLEERIAELEATTVRKGNRKVSLTISGWMAEQVMWWDDGVEQNVYVGGLGSTLASNFKMTGSATILPGVYAGYVLHIEAIDSDSLTWNQIDPVGPAALTDSGIYAVQLLQSYWFLKSDHLGKASVGLQSSPSDNAAILVDGSGSLVPANWVFFDFGGFFLRNQNGNLLNNGIGTGVVGGGVTDAITWGDIGGNCRGGGGIGGDCFGAPRDSIRYDSPTWHGFSVSAGWGGDDFWDVAARYAGEWWGFKMAAAAAYTQWTPDFYGPITGAPVPNVNGDTKYFQAGLYMQHIPTGLFGYGAYGRIETSGVTAGNVVSQGNAGNNNVTFQTIDGGNDIATGDHWYVKGGLRERWMPFGHTVLYGEYGQYSDSQSDLVTNLGYSGAETKFWGLGMVQEVDSAAMSMWLTYRHIEGSVGACNQGTNAAGDAFSCQTIDQADVNLDDFQLIKFGALINF